LGRALAPNASFDVPAGWRQVQCVAELWSLGTAMGNCVASLSSGGDEHIEQLISGEAVYLAHDNEPIMLACVRKVGPKLWTLAETNTSRPGSSIMTTRKVLHASLTSNISKTGGALLDRSPIASMQSMAWRASRGADEELDDFGEDVELI